MDLRNVCHGWDPQVGIGGGSGSGSVLYESGPGGPPEVEIVHREHAPNGSSPLRQVAAASFNSLSRLFESIRYVGLTTAGRKLSTRCSARHFQCRATLPD